MRARIPRTRSTPKSVPPPRNHSIHPFLQLPQSRYVVRRAHYSPKDIPPTRQSSQHSIDRRRRSMNPHRSLTRSNLNQYRRVRAFFHFNPRPLPNLHRQLARLKSHRLFRTSPFRPVHPPLAKTAIAVEQQPNASLNWVLFHQTRVSAHRISRQSPRFLIIDPVLTNR